MHETKLQSQTVFTSSDLDISKYFSAFRKYLNVIFSDTT